MALHPNLQSMLNESLPEMLLVAKYCIAFQKDRSVWNAPGCYGYPAALLLLSVANSIGSYVLGSGNVKRHFKILNDSDYYSLDFTDVEIGVIYDKYRNLLSHHTVMAVDVGLNIGSISDKVLQNQDKKYWLNLVPFYNASVKTVRHFLNNPSILDNNQTILNIYKQ